MSSAGSLGQGGDVSGDETTSVLATRHSSLYKLQVSTWHFDQLCDQIVDEVVAMCGLLDIEPSTEYYLVPIAVHALSTVGHCESDDQDLDWFRQLIDEERSRYANDKNPVVPSPWIQIDVRLLLHAVDCTGNVLVAEEQKRWESMKGPGSTQDARAQKDREERETALKQEFDQQMEQKQQSSASKAPRAKSVFLFGGLRSDKKKSRFVRVLTPRRLAKSEEGERDGDATSVREYLFDANDSKSKPQRYISDVSDLPHAQFFFNFARMERSLAAPNRRRAVDPGGILSQLDSSSVNSLLFFSEWNEGGVRRILRIKYFVHSLVFEVSLDSLDRVYRTERIFLWGSGQSKLPPSGGKKRRTRKSQHQGRLVGLGVHSKKSNSQVEGEESGQEVVVEGKNADDRADGTEAGAPSGAAGESVVSTIAPPSSSRSSKSSQSTQKPYTPRYPVIKSLSDHGGIFIPVDRWQLHLRAVLNVFGRPTTLTSCSNSTARWLEGNAKRLFKLRARLIRALNKYTNKLPKLRNWGVSQSGVDDGSGSVGRREAGGRLSRYGLLSASNSVGRTQTPKLQSINLKQLAEEIGVLKSRLCEFRPSAMHKKEFSL